MTLFQDNDPFNNLICDRCDFVAPVFRAAIANVVCLGRGNRNNKRLFSLLAYVVFSFGANVDRDACYRTVRRTIA